MGGNERFQDRILLRQAVGATACTSVMVTTEVLSFFARREVLLWVEVRFAATTPSQHTAGLLTTRAHCYGLPSQVVDCTAAP